MLIREGIFTKSNDRASVMPLKSCSSYFTEQMDNFTSKYLKNKSEVDKIIFKMQTLTTAEHKWDEWPRGLYSLRRVIEVKLG